MPAAVAKSYSRSTATPTVGRPNLTARARRRLEEHPHFRGRAAGLSIEQRGKTLYLAGCLPSFYLKQLAQETVRRVPGVQAVHNEITVVSAAGISSEN